MEEEKLVSVRTPAELAAEVAHWFEDGPPGRGWDALAELEARAEQAERFRPIVEKVAEGGDIADNGCRLIYAGLMGEALDALAASEPAGEMLWEKAKDLAAKGDGIGAAEAMIDALAASAGEAEIQKNCPKS